MNKICRFSTSKQAKSFDFIFFTALFCSSAGLVLISSAVKNLEGNFLRNQLIALAIGVALYFAAYFFDADKYSRLWFGACVLNFLGIFSLRFFGVGESNTSWLRVGSIGIQPAEIGKLIYIFTFSAHIDSAKRRNFRFRDIIALVVHSCTMILSVILFSRDDGMSLAYIFITLIILYCAGLKMRWFFAGGAVIGALSPFIWNKIFDDYQRYRILAVFRPDEYPDIAYQAERSLGAIRSGGIFGMGYMNGTLTQRNLIPTKHTDSIIAVAGEEFGIAGCISVIFLLTLFIFLLLRASRRADDDVSRLICTGIAGMFIFQTVLNIGMNLGLLPMIGLTLPFFSYGGSSLATMFASAGLVAGISRRIKISDNNKFIYGDFYEKDYRSYSVQ